MFLVLMLRFILHFSLASFCLFPTLFAATPLATTPPSIFAAQGEQSLRITVPGLPATVIGLATSGKLGLRWYGQVLPVNWDTGTLGNTGLTLKVPEALCRPGMVEITLWNRETNLALPYRGYTFVAMANDSLVVEADLAQDRIVTGRVYESTLNSQIQDQIKIIRISTGALIESLSLPLPQRVVGFTPDARYAWIVLDPQKGLLGRFDLSTRAVDQNLDLALREAESFGLDDVTIVRSDPRFLIYKRGGGNEVYLDGRLLTLTADRPEYPVPYDDQGRILTNGPSGRRLCVLRTIGFDSCQPVASNIFSIRLTYGSRAVGSTAFYNLSTGEVLALGTGDRYWLAADSHRVLGLSSNANGPANLIWDSDTLLPLTTQPHGDIVRTLGQNWFVSFAPNPFTDRRVVVGQSPYLQPLPRIDAILNSATGASTGLVPGEIVSIYGANLGPPGGDGLIIDDGLKLGKDVAGTTVSFNGALGAVLYASDTQVNVVVPEGVAFDDSVVVQLHSNEIPSARVTMPVAATSPGLFPYPLNGRFYAAALNHEGAVQSPSAPLRRGDLVSLWATGLGLPAGQEADGIAARAKELANRPVVRFGGKTASVLYAGLAPFLTVGVTQIVVEVPADAPTGDAIEITLEAGGKSQGDTWAAIR